MFGGLISNCRIIFNSFCKTLVPITKDSSCVFVGKLTSPIFSTNTSLPLDMRALLDRRWRCIFAPLGVCWCSTLALLDDRRPRVQIYVHQKGKPHWATHTKKIVKPYRNATLAHACTKTMNESHWKAKLGNASKKPIHES